MADSMIKKLTLEHSVRPMERHHRESIANLIREFEGDSSVKALILGGSLAHGFAKPDSDIDVTFVVESSDFQTRKHQNRLVYNHKELCTYEKGYIDGKYVDGELLKLIALRGSEPARYAFKDNTVLFSRMDNISELLADIVRYPAEGKEERIHRFASQLLAWKWYYSEAVLKHNRYLTFLSLQKIVLFSSRIILTFNELLYPYHKWLLQVLQTADRKPPEMISDIEQILSMPSAEIINGYCDKILSFINWDETKIFWPNQFMKDSELNWMNGEPPIDDL